MVGYSPFGSPDLPWGEKLPHLLAEPALAQVARKHGRSVAQVILTWQMARGVGVIPKVRQKKSIAIHFKIFRALRDLP